MKVISCKPIEPKKRAYGRSLLVDAIVKERLFEISKYVWDNEKDMEEDIKKAHIEFQRVKESEKKKPEISDITTNFHIPFSNPRITVAEVIKDGHHYFGVSACNPKDNFDLNEGKRIAYDRAVKQIEEENKK